MKSSNRVLVGFGIAVAVMIAAAIILVFTVGGRELPLLPQNTPEGTVQRYLLAVQNKDFKQAYAYFAQPSLSNNNPKEIPRPLNSYEMWLNSAQNSQRNSWKATLEQVNVSGDSASVQIIVEIFSPGGPFGNPVRSSTQIFNLQRAADGWLITSPTELYWIY